MKYRYIAIEGNIGAGKTTLATLLHREWGGKLILEEFEENSFLPKFYQEPERYAFPLEMSFVASRFKQLKKHLFEQDMFNNHLIADYIFYKCLIFAKNNLKEDEYDLYLHLFEIINQQLPQPDLLIYLHTPIPKLQKQIHARGRSYEQQIADSYLQNIQKGYFDFIHKSANQRILLIDTGSSDFVENMGHFEQIKSLLQVDYSPGIHRIILTAT